MMKRSFLLVHGGMHGGWCWRRILPPLFAAGHHVVAPTLAGLGHRFHLGSAATDLAAHIRDVIACADAEEMEDFILVGHSYGGMVITGVADRIGGRIAHLVYLDALVPRDGESASDIVSRGEGADYSNFTDGMATPMPGYDFGLTDPEDIAWVRRRVTPQSVATLTQKLVLSRAPSRMRRTFVECVEERDGQVLMAGIAARAREIERDPSWDYRVLQAGHDCMISHPSATAELLLSIA